MPAPSTAALGRAGARRLPATLWWLTEDRLDGELQDLTALMDELGTNLDVYSDRKADIRKALKALNDAAPRWLGILRTLATRGPAAPRTSETPR